MVNIMPRISPVKTKNSPKISKPVSKTVATKYRRTRQSYSIDVEKFLWWPGNVYWKNLDGIYLGCNDRQAQVLGLDSRHDWVGKTIYDCIDGELADRVDSIDNLIMQTGVARCVMELGPSSSGSLGYYLSTKFPLRNKKGKIVGLFGLSTEIIEDDLKAVQTQLATVGLPINEFPIAKNTLPVKKINSKLPALSSREKECLYYLIRGMTARQIGSQLKLSNRTVEFYLERIKVKLRCASKSELIAKVLDEKIVDR